ncbi:MAG: hypothetical protein ABI706_16765 [Ilumatobacteraceae bacterium]
MGGTEIEPNECDVVSRRTGAGRFPRAHDYAAFLITRDDTALSTSNFADHRLS